MAASAQNDDEMITGINVTPLVDVVLVLLIILMVTASYIVSKSIPLELPNAKTGEAYWNFDMFSQCCGSALIVNDKVYVGNEVGVMLVFRHSSDPAVAMPNGEPLASMDMGNSVYMTPVVANGVLFIATKNSLYAIAPDEADDGQ